MDIIRKFEPLFGEWYAESFIGAGSFGRVYKIYRVELGEKYYSAVKYISIPEHKSEIDSLRDEGMDKESISGYYTSIAKDITAETRLMSRLRGVSNIVSYEDSRVLPKEGGIGYDIFIRMELLESLSEKARNAPLTSEDVTRLGMDICRALIVCAGQDIIHRDIKPDNIFVNSLGDYKLGDFGIARKLEKTATFMSKKGTYNYMAPEVYKGEKYGASCDIYSLGLVMYRFMNRGRLPFLPPAPSPITVQDREEALKLRFTGEILPLPCCADEALGRIILKACAFRPEDRYASAEEMYEALQAYAMSPDESRHSAAPQRVEREEKAVPEPAEATVGPFSYNNPIPKSVPAPQAAAPKSGDETLSEMGGNAFRRDPESTVGVFSERIPVRSGSGYSAPQDGAFPERTPVIAADKPKKKRKTALVVALLAAALVLVAGAFTVIFLLTNNMNDEIVQFSDPDFERAVRAECGLTGDIRRSDILGITELELNSEGISDISDVAMFSNLTKLSLAGNEIKDISPLIWLNKLRELDISFNFALEDLSPLEKLTGVTSLVLSQSGSNYDLSSLLRRLPNLTKLGLSYCTLSDPSVLGELTGLTSLSLNSCGIFDLSPLRNLKDLTGFSFWDDSSKILDISPLRELKKLKSLTVACNNLRDVSPISGLTELTDLFIFNTYHISDLSSITGLKNLASLGIYLSNDADISGLTELPNLTSLTLVSDSIRDFAPLSRMTKLTSLQLRVKNFSDLSVLGSLTELEELRIEYSAVSDLSPLSRLVNLTRLTLDYNKNATDFSPLSSLKGLTYFSLYYYNADESIFIDLSPIGSLTDLTTLWLQSDAIRDITPLRGLTNLTELLIGSTSLYDVSPLSGLTKLTDLSIYNSKISDLSPLSGLTDLTDLSISSSNVSDLSPLSGLTNLRTLEIRSFNVAQWQIDRLQEQLPKCKIRFNN